MLITHINYSDISGGAARAAYRLHLGLNLLNTNSHMLVVDKKSTDINVHQITKNILDSNSDEIIKESFINEFIQNKYINKNRTEISNTLFTFPYPGYNINTIPLIRNSDIINFHWISYFLSLSNIKNLFLLEKPIVWTLHDEKPFTGGCHYTAGCKKYKEENCSGCLQLKDDYFNIVNDIFLDKIEVFEKSNLTIVTPSKWLADCAKESKLFKNKRIEVIPNSLETDVFYPIDKKIAKKRIGIDENSLTILFGAENGNEKRKGFHLLLKAIMECLKNNIFLGLTITKKINILCFGDPSKDLSNLNLEIKSMGYIKSDTMLSLIYSASDFVVLPSIEDNLPNIILEAFSCKTPVIAFNTGGMPDIIIPEETGKIAKFNDHIDLANKILEITFSDQQRISMQNNCRIAAETKFALKVQANSYLSLYNDIKNSSKALLYNFNYNILNDYNANLDTQFGSHIKKNNIMKDTFYLYKDSYYLSRLNQSIENSKSYKFSRIFIEPFKIIDKIKNSLKKKINKISLKKTETNIQNKIRVLFDYQIFTLQTYGGISRYFTELLSCFNNFKLIDYELPIEYSNNFYLNKCYSCKKPIKKYINDSEDNNFINFLPNINFRGKRKLFRLLKFFNIISIKPIEYYYTRNRKTTIKQIQKDSFDIYHPTYYNEFFLKYLKGKPFVLTIYDMIHEIFSDRFPLLNDETIEIKKKLALKADKIIAISENTKNDIIKLYGIPQEKIKVIYLATSLKIPDNKNISILNLPKKYILFVGERTNYKNFCFFTHSIIPLLREDKDLFLVCAGGGSFTKEELYLIENNFIKDKILSVSFDDETLALLYYNAQCFVFPSLYEGFGIPILEAFACGCPIAISNTSCFPEIAGNAAIYFNPYDEKSMRDSIKEIIYNDTERENLIIKGFERLKNFSWQKTSVETYELYESLINDRKTN